MTDVINIQGPQTLTLDAGDLNLIVGALRELPYKQVANTLDKIKAQLLASKAAAAPAAGAPETVKQPPMTQPRPSHEMAASIVAADAAAAAAKKEASQNAAPAG